MFTGLYAKLIALALVVSLVLGGIWYVKHLQAEVADLTQQVSTLTAQNAQLTASIEHQNAAVQALKEEGAARLAAAAVELAKSKAATKAAQARAGVIYKQPPSTPGNDCKSTLDLLNSAVAPAPAASDSEGLQ
jgi:cell division protein FtsB